MINNIIGPIMAWHVIGVIILVVAAVTDCAKAITNSNGVEFVNPCFIYKHVEVNKLGAIMLAMLYSILLPIPTVCYWFYKLCTIRRKSYV